MSDLPNPFPGLRPFQPGESRLFFGRDEHCDELLARLARRRLVAVVGLSGSGKSSLVLAGLIPALERGYLPSAGSAWRIIVLRPGGDPMGNLATGLGAVGCRSTSTAGRVGEIRARLDSSSRGLVTAARHALGAGESLLVVVDQFEEIFRFRRLARTNLADDEASAFVQLLVAASQQDEVPIYVVLTMRSDYLGDCARFTGLPEALNDSQFLVPRLTREQLKEVIECPMSVADSHPTPTLVQRLLHDVERLSYHAESQAGAPPDGDDDQDQDQLPILQHTLMRVWQVSAEDRGRGAPIDLKQYEDGQVGTIVHALDRHAEDAYARLASDEDRELARRVFQRLTEKDPANREVRRPTPLRELAAVALRKAPEQLSAVDEERIRGILEGFSAGGRTFVTINDQKDVDITHESLIRRWMRLRAWVDDEAQSRQIYRDLSSAASGWERKERSLYRGPELTQALRWWTRERPTAAWADRYGGHFELAHRFLTRSEHQRTRFRAARRATAAVALGIAAIMFVLWQQASRAERRAAAAAAEARMQKEEMVKLRAQADAKGAETALFAAKYEQALDALKKGNTAGAVKLANEAGDLKERAESRQLLANSELAELDRLRREEATWRRDAADLRQQLASQGAVKPASCESFEAANRALEAKLVQSEMSLKKATDELRARPAPVIAAAPPSSDAIADLTAIQNLLREYRAAYEKLDAAAVAKLVPTIEAGRLAQSFAGLRSYAVDVVNPHIAIAGDKATVTAGCRIAVRPKVGKEQTRTQPTVFKMARTERAWTITGVEEPEAGGQ